MSLRKAKKTPDREPEIASKRKRTPKKASAFDARLHRWRWPIIVLLFFSISVAVLFAWWVSLLNAGFHVDDALKNLLVFHVGTTIHNRFDPRLEVVLVSAGPPTSDASANNSPKGAAGQNALPDLPFGPINPAHRRYFAKLLNKLAEVHPRMIVFDMAFSKDAPDRETDREFAQAIESLQKSGTEVMVGADLAEGQVEPILASALEPTLKNHWAIWDGGVSKGTAGVRFVRLGIETPGQEEVVGERTIIPSLALEVFEHAHYPEKNLQAFLNPLAAEVSLRDGGPDGLVLSRFPVDKDLYFLVDMLSPSEMGLHPPLADFSDYLNKESYKRSLKDKVIIIGYEKGDDKRVSESADDRRCGADIQASAMSNMLQNSYIHPLAFPYHYLVILIMISLGGVLRIRFCNLMNYRLPIKVPGFVDWKPQVPTVLLVLSLIYIFTAILAYRVQRAIFSMSYHILALFLAYLLTSAICARLGFK